MIRDIAATVAAETGVSIAELQSRNRTARIARARQEAMLRCLEAGATQPATGRFFNRDRATVAHAAICAKARRAGLKPPAQAKRPEPTTPLEIIAARECRAAWRHWQ